MFVGSVLFLHFVEREREREVYMGFLIIVQALIHVLIKLKKYI